jgi:P27 family predicted phage terminase small subunit
MPKPADKLLGHRKRRVPAAVIGPPGLAEPPASPEHFLPPTQDAWRTYWASELATFALDVDRASIARLFAMYDQHARAMDVVRQALVVKGSTGQIRVNPLADHALKLEGAIVRLENELGLTPAARVRLGIHLTRERKAAPPPVISHYAHLRVVNK